MADYSTPNEIVVMIRILGEARNNYMTTEKIYAEISRYFQIDISR